MKQIAIAVLMLLTITPCLLNGQQGHRKRLEQESSFIIDTAKPYVYLEVDHVGPRLPRGKDEPSVGIYLRLKNNSNLPIVVSTSPGPAGSPDCDLMDVVVPNLKMLFVVSGGGPISSPPVPSTPTQEPPLGYVWEVSTATKIPPGGHISFSMPINHVGPTWHFEIPFRFDLPKTHQRQPESHVDLFDDDLPLKHRATAPSAVPLGNAHGFNANPR